MDKFRDTQQICSSVEEKNESLQDNQQIYNSVDVKKKKNHCRDNQQIYTSVDADFFFLHIICELISFEVNKFANK